MTPGEEANQRYGDITSIFVFHLIALAAAIMTTSIIGQEVEQRTIVYILTRPVSRWKLLLMRYLAAVTTVAVIGLVCVLLLSIVMFGNPLSNDLLVPDIMAIVLGAFAYSAFCLLVSLLIVRSMIVCVLFILVWETAVPNMPGDLYRISIFSYMEGIAQHPLAEGSKGSIAFFSGNIGDNVLSAGSSYPVLIIVTTALVAISLFWFTRFEYVPREDAE